MVLRGVIYELLILINPEMHRKYVVIGNNGKPILYVKLQKYLYSYIMALLFCENLSRDLKRICFVLNQYEPC